MKRNIYALSIIIISLFIISITGCECGMYRGEEQIVRMPSTPDFGINETVTNTYGSDNFYTYYVNMNTGTDVSNPYGSPALPRATIPTTLVAGDVVEIHGGPYTGIGINQAYYFTASGTKSQPIFIRGKLGSEPILRAHFYVQGSYLILENLIFDQNDEERISLSIYPRTDAYIHHISVRYCEFRFFHYNVATPPLNPGHSSVSHVNDAGTGYYPNNMVFYHNNYHDNGTYTTTADPNGRDVHAIALGNSEYVWILENEMTRTAADSVQIRTDPETARPINHVYIGGNRMHNEGENAVDLKRCQDVIIAGNTMYNFNSSFESPGNSGTRSAIVVHMGGTNPVTPRRILIINNEIYNSDDSALVTDDNPTEIYFVGNIVHDIGLTSTNSAAILIRATGSQYIYNNLIYNVATAIRCTNGSDSHATSYVYNNIFANIAPDSPPDYNYHFYIGGTQTNSKIDYNLFYQNPGTVRISWLSFYGNLAQFKSSTGQCAHCIEGDPLFVDTTFFRLNTGSPAINTGMDLINALKSKFNISYDEDYDGNPRPVGLWDIGPHEYQ